MCVCVLGQTPAPYEGVSYYLDHCIGKYGAARLTLDACVRFVLSPCGMAGTNPANKSAATEALKSLYKHKGPAVVAVVEKLTSSTDAAVIKAANAAIQVRPVTAMGVSCAFRAVACTLLSIRSCTARFASCSARLSNWCDVLVSPRVVAFLSPSMSMYR